MPIDGGGCGGLYAAARGSGRRDRGGRGGLGARAGTACGAGGAKIVLVARTVTRLDAVRAEIEATGVSALGATCDIAPFGNGERMAQTARAVFGRIDALAVIAYREPDQRLLRECDNDLVSWRSIVDFNVFATLQVIKAVSEQMADG